MALRREIADAAVVAQQSERIAAEIAADATRTELERPGGSPMILVGIRTGGLAWAERLAGLIAATGRAAPPLGALDIALYRDDISSRVVPDVGATELPGRIDGAEVVLVDDVLFTGRTIRAALDALMDYGRPRRVQLAVLVDRGHRELPIAANFVGVVAPTARNEVVRVQFAPSHGADRVIVLGPEGESQ